MELIEIRTFCISNFCRSNLIAAPKKWVGSYLRRFLRFRNDLVELVLLDQRTGIEGKRDSVSGKPPGSVSLAEFGLPDDFSVLDSVFPVVPVELLLWLLLLLLPLSVMIRRRRHHSHRGHRCSGRTLLLVELLFVEDVLVVVAIAWVRPADGKATVYLSY